MSKSTIQQRIEIKNVKHDFTPQELMSLGGELARGISEHRGVEAEFDQVKATYKAKIAEKDAKIDSLSTALVNRFEMRNKRCVVVFRPKDRKKDFYVIISPEGTDVMMEEKPALTEDMTRDDYQQELIDAEAKFEKRVEIPLFNATDRDSGVMVIGMFNSRWYSALRITVGKHKIEERLNSEQKAFKLRSDAVNAAGKRALEWFETNLKVDAKGFKDPVLAAIAAQIERAE